MSLSSHPATNSAVKQLIFPSGLLVVAGLSSLAVAPALDAHLLPPAQIACGIFLFAVAMLAVRLRSLRVFLGSLSLGAYLCLLSFAAIEIRFTPFLMALAAIDSALLLLVDDSFFDWQATAWWSGLLFVQWTVFIAAVRWVPAFFVSTLGNRITLPFISFGIAELLFVASGLALIGKFIYSPDSVGSGLLWAMMALAPGLRMSLQSQSTASACVAISGAVLAVAAIERSHWIAYHDELTGLRARRAFNEALAALGNRYCIAIVDVDHFKKFNDTFGHDVGDQVLRKVASQLSRVGGGGMAFRCGGEEFALVFPDCDMADAYGNAEEVRLNIEDDGFIARGPSRSKRERDDRRSAPGRRLQARAVETNVTVSIGIAEAVADLTPNEVAAAADKALYRAKHLGRNRVERAILAAVRGKRKRQAATAEQPAIRS